MKPSLTNMSFEQKDFLNWPDVFEENLLPDVKFTYKIIRKQSILAWFEGQNIKFICKNYQINRTQLYRWIYKCISIHRDGRLCGWRGIIPHKN